MDTPRRPTRRTLIPIRVTGLLFIFVLQCGATSVIAQGFETRAVIGTDVACRAEPNRDSPVVLGHQLGSTFTIGGRTGRDADQDVWYSMDRGPRPECWVYGPLTVAMDSYQITDDVLLAIAEHVLALEDVADFEHLVAVDNLLIERQRRSVRYRTAPEMPPPLLELRHLEVVNRAARMIGYHRYAEREPLKFAWMLAHPDRVRYFEPGALYHVPGQHFWDLYERHAESPVAETIAWVAAEMPVFTDECYTDCSLNLLAQTYMPYWDDFPQGTHVVEAIEHGIDRVAHASRFCVLMTSGNLCGNGERTQTLIDQIRDSLDEVRVAEKDPPVRYLDEVETGCVSDPVEDLDDLRAIPGLACALGSGFTMVPRQLASFGEEAIPAVLEFVDSDRTGTTDNALTTLRMIVERSGTLALSDDACSIMMPIAERWLMENPQSILTLGAAIDLAVVLEDPGLWEIVQTLASDPNEASARVLTTARSLERIQQRAADRLAGVPAVLRPGSHLRDRISSHRGTPSRKKMRLDRFKFIVIHRLRCPWPQRHVPGTTMLSRGSENE